MARRLAKVFAWLAGIALAVAVLGLLGVDVVGWCEQAWDVLTGIGLGYLVAGWSLQTLQTTLTALAWYFILRAAYPDDHGALPAGAGGLRDRGRAERLPAGEHRHRRDVADVHRDHPRREPPGVLGGMVVQKIFFTLAGAFVYVYLFASVPGAFERQFELPHDHPGLMLAIGAGAVLLIGAPRAHLPAQASGLDRERQAGRRDPRAAARSTWCASSCRRSARGWPSSA